MKILHTADLHLGKVFHDQSLAGDQEAMLEDLGDILGNGGYDLLLIAGDVYDRSIPSPEAVELFGAFLGKVKNLRPSPEVLVIPGNHDSASRLGFGRELFARLGIRFGVSAEECDKPLILEKDGNKCAFFLLPFLNPGSLSTIENGETILLRSQSDLAKEAAGRMEKAREDLAARGVVHSVLAAHLFAYGGKEAGSERVFLGNAELVNTNLFRGFDYIALGHLHSCQNTGGNAWYPGSPLVYSFGEVSETPQQPASGKRHEKFFLSVELGEGGARVEKIPVKPRRRVTRLRGPFARFNGDIGADGELLASANDYLEICLTDRSIKENARDILRKRFPFLLSLRQDEALSGFTMTTRTSLPAERQSVSGDFKNFLEDLYGGADAEELKLFDKLLAETGEEEVSS